MNPVFLAIDPSITCTALALIRYAGKKDGAYKFNLLDKFSLKVNKRDMDRFKKKLAMNDLFKFVIEQYKDNISFAVFENYSYGSNGHLADLGELNGLYKLCLDQNGIPFDVVPPSSVKKAVAGSGKASKEEVAAALGNWILNIKDHTFNNTDESDAVAIGIAYAVSMLAIMEKQNEHKEDRGTPEGDS